MAKQAFGVRGNLTNCHCKFDAGNQAKTGWNTKDTYFNNRWDTNQVWSSSAISPRAGSTRAHIGSSLHTWSTSSRSLYLDLENDWKRSNKHLALRHAIQEPHRRTEPTKLTFGEGTTKFYCLVVALDAYILPHAGCLLIDYLSTHHIMPVSSLPLRLIAYTGRSSPDLVHTFPCAAEKAKQGENRSGKQK